MPKKPIDIEKVRRLYAEVAYRAYAKNKNIAKTFDQLDAESVEAWCAATDAMATSFMMEMDQQDMFVHMLKLAMRDALTDDNTTQLKTRFTSAGGFPGECRIIIAPERMRYDFGKDGLTGKTGD